MQFAAPLGFVKWRRGYLAKADLPLDRLRFIASRRFERALHPRFGQQTPDILRPAGSYARNAENQERSTPGPHRRTASFAHEALLSLRQQHADLGLERPRGLLGQRGLELLSGFRAIAFPQQHGCIVIAEGGVVRIFLGDG